MKFALATLSLCLSLHSAYGCIEDYVMEAIFAPKPTSAIAVVDMNDFYDAEKQEQFLDTLSHAMTTTGFFAVRNTGVNRDITKAAYKEAALFFKGDSDLKTSCSNLSGGQRGFTPGERAKGKQEKDFKEFFTVGPDLSPEAMAKFGLFENVWPEGQPEFKQSMTAIYNELNQYTRPLLQAIVAVINKNATTKLEEDHLYDMTVGGDTLLRALYYPAIDKLDKRKPLFWAAEHTDINFLTILPHATAKGLQVLIDGKWQDVIVPEDAFVINIGDKLQHLTNGLFVSSRHRVLAEKQGYERFSMVYFVHPANDVWLTPLESCIAQTGGVQKYSASTSLELLWERLLELNLA
ncbi:MAG: isopenicillin N synthase family oxygenase, partial [Verrucomicrobia bacterium]|nr:isopenicillin N synthase family oxygenase [Verrucomicrobiota bacterium]